MKIYTFDFFDTIFFRRDGQWHDFLLKLGAELIHNEIIETREPTEFLEKRLLLEKRATKYFREHGLTHAPTLGDIYRYDRTLIPLKVDRALDECEYSLEKKRGYVPGFMSEYLVDLKCQGHEVVIISNSYYSNDNIRDILHDCSNIDPEVIDSIHIFTSFSCKTNKQNNLFGVVKNIFADRYEQVRFIHTGDNHALDVAKPLEYEFESIHALTNIAQRNIDYLKSENLPCPNILSISSSRYVLRDVSMANKAKAEYMAGILAPAMYMFARFVEERRIPGSNLYFLEREGVILREYYCKFKKYAHGASVDSDLLPVSRYSLSPLVLLTNDEALIGKTISRIREKTGKDESCIQKELLARLESVLIFLSNNFQTGKNYTLVDFGYKGTITLLIRIGLSHLNISCRLRTLFVFNDKGGNYGNEDIHALFDQNILNSNIIKEAGGAVGLFEELLMPEFGSTLYYTPDGVVRENHFVQDIQKNERLELVRLGLKLVEELSMANIHVSADDIPSMNRLLLRLFTNINFLQLFAHWKHEVNMGSEKQIKLFPDLRDIHGLTVSESKIKQLKLPLHIIRHQLHQFLKFNFTATYEITLANGAKKHEKRSDMYYFANRKPVLAIQTPKDIFFNYLKVSYKVDFGLTEHCMEIYFETIDGGCHKKILRSRSGDLIRCFGMEMSFDNHKFSLSANTIELAAFECIIF